MKISKIGLKKEMEKEIKEMGTEFKDLDTTPTLTLDPFQAADKKETPAVQQVEEPVLDDSILTEEERQTVEAFAKQITAAGYSQISAPGIEAVIAAYAQGEEWYQEMKKYVGENITFLHEWMEEHIPQIKVTRTEGTYLVWMDFRGLGIAEENLKDFVENRAGLWLDGGKMFGESGSGFQRINVACPRKTLEKALTQLETAVKNL